MVKPALELIHDAAVERLKAFCGHCASEPPEGALPASRVCSHCGLGLLLEASAETAPTPADAFLIVDASMTLRAVSRRAERVLGVAEPDAVDQHLTSMLAPADADPRAAQDFHALVLLAATGGGEPQTVAVRPAGEFGVRHWVRISTCGPQNAALLLVYDMS